MKFLPSFFKELGKALQACEEDPERLLIKALGYTRPISRFFWLYRLLMDRYDLRKKEQAKEKPLGKEVNEIDSLPLPELL